MMHVPFLDLRAAHAECGAAIEEATLRVARSGRYIGGPEVEAFEEAWASYVQAPHCIGVSNGTDALSLALGAVGVAPGDEVIVPVHSCPATWMAVHAVGAIPVPAAVDARSMTIDPAEVGRCISPRTRALVAVHLYGQPADLDALLALAQRHGIPLVEDAAQAHGARFGDRPIGAHGDAVAWSFYPTKNLGALGDAGAVTTARKDVADHVRSGSDYGRDASGRIISPGRNARLDPLQAAVLRAKLPNLGRWNQLRREIAETYRAELTGLPIELPAESAGTTHAWHLFVVRSARRDALRQLLQRQGVETMVHYDWGWTPPSQATRGQELPGTVLSLPLLPWITVAQVRHVCRAMREAHAAPDVAPLAGANA
jgi:dTDP-4-amino-4,6-dideoxygalactose transaminase